MQNGQQAVLPAPAASTPYGAARPRQRPTLRPPPDDGLPHPEHERVRLIAEAAGKREGRKGGPGEEGATSSGAPSLLTAQVSGARLHAFARRTTTTPQQPTPVRTAPPAAPPPPPRVVPQVVSSRGTFVPAQQVVPAAQQPKKGFRLPGQPVAKGSRTDARPKSRLAAQNIKRTQVPPKAEVPPPLVKGSRTSRPAPRGLAVAAVAPGTASSTSTPRGPRPTGGTTLKAGTPASSRAAPVKTKTTVPAAMILAPPPADQNSFPSNGSSLILSEDLDEAFPASDALHARSFQRVIPRSLYDQTPIRMCTGRFYHGASSDILEVSLPTDPVTGLPASIRDWKQKLKIDFFDQQEFDEVFSPVMRPADPTASETNPIPQSVLFKTPPVVSYRWLIILEDDEPIENGSHRPNFEKHEYRVLVRARPDPSRIDPFDPEIWEGDKWMILALLEWLSEGIIVAPRRGGKTILVSTGTYQEFTARSAAPNTYGGLPPGAYGGGYVRYQAPVDLRPPPPEPFDPNARPAGPRWTTPGPAYYDEEIYDDLVVHPQIYSDEDEEEHGEAAAGVVPPVPETTNHAEHAPPDAGAAFPETNGAVDTIPAPPLTGILAQALEDIGTQPPPPPPPPPPKPAPPAPDAPRKRVRRKTIATKDLLVRRDILRALLDGLRKGSRWTKMLDKSALEYMAGRADLVADPEVLLLLVEMWNIIDIFPVRQFLMSATVGPGTSGSASKLVLGEEDLLERGMTMEIYNVNHDKRFWEDQDFLINAINRDCCFLGFLSEHLKRDLAFWCRLLAKSYEIAPQNREDILKAAYHIVGRSELPKEILDLVDEYPVSEQSGSIDQQMSMRSLGNIDSMNDSM